MKGTELAIIGDRLMRPIIAAREVALSIYEPRLNSMRNLREMCLRFEENYIQNGGGTPPVSVLACISVDFCSVSEDGVLLPSFDGLPFVDPQIPYTESECSERVQPLLNWKLIRVSRSCDDVGYSDIESRNHYLFHNIIIICDLVPGESVGDEILRAFWELPESRFCSFIIRPLSDWPLDEFEE